MPRVVYRHFLCLPVHVLNRCCDTHRAGPSGCVLAESGEKSSFANESKFCDFLGCALVRFGVHAYDLVIDAGHRRSLNTQEGLDP